MTEKNHVRYAYAKNIKTFKRSLFISKYTSEDIHAQPIYIYVFIHNTAHELAGNSTCSHRVYMFI